MAFGIGDKTPTEPAPIQLDQNLIATIAAAVALALKAQGEAQPQLDMQLLGDAIAAGISKTTRRKVTFGEYALTGHSRFHPKPFAETPILRRQSWQNGIWMNPATLHDEEITLLNSITHSGRYMDRQVEVILRGEGASEEVDIRFPNKDINDQLMMKGYAKDFADMLRQIKLVQDEERLEKEAEDQARRDRPKQRQAFSTKATQEARERAGV